MKAKTEIIQHTKNILIINGDDEYLKNINKNNDNNNNRNLEIIKSAKWRNK